DQLPVRLGQPDLDPGSGALIAPPVEKDPDRRDITLDRPTGEGTFAVEAPFALQRPDPLLEQRGVRLPTGGEPQEARHDHAEVAEALAREALRLLREQHLLEGALNRSSLTPHSMLVLLFA